MVSDLIEDGRRIVELLPQKGFDVAAGFWLKDAADGQWYFYIASPAAERERLNDAYRRLYTLIRQMAPFRWLDPLTVKLIGPSNPIAKDVLAIHNRAPASPGSAIRWNGNRLGDLYVEGVYLYPLPAPASS